jgi:hypothetical protein
MYSYDRDVDRSLDSLRERQSTGGRTGTALFTPKEIEGIKQIVKKMGGIPPIRQDSVEKDAIV